MDKKIEYWQISGFVFTAIAGTLLHFLFDWAGGNVVIALLSAVNESIWEHLKLLFYPMLLFALAEYFCWSRKDKDFWCIKLIGILHGLVLIPLVYYTYTGLLGTSADWFNIMIFFLSAGVAYWLETKLFQKGFACSVGKEFSVVLICLLVIIFTVFTFAPPHIPLFEDPITGTYGFIWEK